MSTKNLARTIIEGGRTRSNRWSRRYSHQKHRAAERGTLHALLAAPDADHVTFRREHVFKQFNDKLGPARRWLARQAGRPWSKVRADLLVCFDTRTTAGRHIVFDHMLPWVEQPHHFAAWREFEIDARGLLRACPVKRHRFRPLRLPQPRHEIDAWMAGRRIGDRGGVLFWFTPTPTEAYRQHHRLSEADVARWRALPVWFREKHSAII